MENLDSQRKLIVYNTPQLTEDDHSEYKKYTIIFSVVPRVYLGTPKEILELKQYQVDLTVYEGFKEAVVEKGGDVTNITTFLLMVEVDGLLDKYTGVIPKKALKKLEEGLVFNRPLDTENQETLRKNIQASKQLLWVNKRMVHWTPKKDRKA